MITEIEIEGFKSLEKVRLKLGSLNLFVGTNASGKSNFLDGLRVLQGIGYGLTIDEIFGGKPKGPNNEVWEPVRGGSSRACFIGKNAAAGKQVRFDLQLRMPAAVNLNYSITFSPEPASVEFEQLLAGSETVFMRNVETLIVEPSDAKAITGLSPTQPALSTRWVGDLKVSESLQNELSNMQRVDPSMPVLRDYSRVRQVRRMGERGENFAALVQSILSDKDLKRAYLSWLQHLTPVELDDVTLLRGALEEPLFALTESGQTMPAPVLSDGTLRFAAITAAFFQPDMPGILTIEEIENGIHPSRLRLLVELLKSQSGGNGPQVFATTHSPVVLAWLDESDYETTFFCKRDEETGASIIKPLSEVPHLVDLIRKNHSLGDLFMQGWMEAAL